MSFSFVRQRQPTYVFVGWSANCRQVTKLESMLITNDILNEWINFKRIRITCQTVMSFQNWTWHICQVETQQTAVHVHCILGTLSPVTWLYHLMLSTFGLSEPGLRNSTFFLRPALLMAPTPEMNEAFFARTQRCYFMKKVFELYCMYSFIPHLYFAPSKRGH